MTLKKLEWINNRLTNTKEQSSKLKDKLVQINQLEQQKEKKNEDRSFRKEEPSFMAGGNVNWYSQYRKQ